MTDATTAGHRPVPGESAGFRPVDYLVVAAWFALAFGLTEAGVLVYRRVVLNAFIWSSRDVIWMAPLSYLIAYSPTAGLALLAQRRLPTVPLPWLAGMASSVAVAMLLRLLSNHRIHWIALIIVGAGAGVQVARLVARRPALVTKMRRTLPALFAIVLMAAGISRGWRWYAERRALAALPAVGAGPQNILLLILDTVGARHLSLFGYGRLTTPNLERWASKGVAFDRAIAPSGWTLESHASFFTGRYPFELRVDFTTPLDDTHATIAGVLSSRGYNTGGFVANQAYASYESGLARGFIHYEGYRVTLKQILFSSELGQFLGNWNSQLILRTRDAKPVTEVHREFLTWLGDAGTERPFFAFLNYMDAHIPYTAPDSMRVRFGADTTEGLVDSYDAAIANLDHEIGALLDTLDARGLLANTVVVLTSDHGEQFGEHGLWEHGNSLYYQLLHVPLLIIHPSAPGGRRIPDAVGLRELPATMVRYAGLNGTPPFPGRSLSRFWEASGADATPEPYVFAEIARRPRSPRRFPNAEGPMVALFQGRYHYIRNARGHEALFDYWGDPAEAKDLVATPEGRAQLPAFRALAKEGLPAR